MLNRLLCFIGIHDDEYLSSTYFKRSGDDGLKGNWETKTSICKRCLRESDTEYMYFTNYSQEEQAIKNSVDTIKIDLI